MADVTLVYVPFGSLERPSLGLGLLKSALGRSNISCDVRYSTFPFAERVGLELYGKLSWVRDEMLGEWVFSEIAFPGFEPEGDYLDRALDSFYHPRDTQGRAFGRHYLEFAREQACDFILDEARSILEAGPRIVGVSSTFNQNCAMLALTRVIRRLSPDTVTVCGGANCEGPMGRSMARHFPWLDYVVSGEGETCFPLLCAQILADEHPRSPLPAGVLSGELVRSGPTVSAPPPAAAPPPPPAAAPPARTLPLAPSAAQPTASTADLAAIDDVPVPDFDEYFAALDAYADRDCITPGLVVETARGCWWGAVHHCTFCGLNGSTMTFRSKSAERVAAELDELSSRYGLRRFLVADNILDQRYYRDLLPVLAGRGADERYDLYLEIKANVTRDHLAALHAAGARWIVAGIESLHDDVLRLMDKGTTSWINLQALKWSRELGIHMSWNMLAGLPGEQDEWFAEMADLVPLVSHLEPPNDVRSIRFDRFSPYQARPAEYGLTLRPSWPYPYLYPLGETELAELVYFFESDTRAPVRLNPFRRGLFIEESLPSMGGPGRNRLQSAVREWVTAFRSPTPPMLSLAEEPDRSVVTDTRALALQHTVELTGIDHRVHRACARALGLEQLAAAVAADGGAPVPLPQVRESLQRMVEQRLVVRLGRKHLALAIPGIPPCLPWENEDGFPGGWFVTPRPPRYPPALQDYMNRPLQEVTR